MGGARRGVIKGYISLRKTAQRRASIDEHHFLQLNLVTRRKRRAQNKLLAKLLDEHMAFTWPELVTLLRRLGSYLTTCQSLGHTPEKPCKGSFNVRVGHDLHLAAALAATRKKVTLNDLTRQALSDFLHHHSADACPAIS